MTKEEYIKLAKKRFKSKSSREIMFEQINRYYDAKDNYVGQLHDYKIDDDVKLSKGTLLHGTYKNIEHGF